VDVVFCVLVCMHICEFAGWANVILIRMVNSLITKILFKQYLRKYGELFIIIIN
jgi:uncharacterized membrane protein